MIIITKFIKFLKEHTVKAIFYSLVTIILTIILGFIIGLVVKNWKLFISVLYSIVKYEHFHIYVIFLIFAVVLFLLYKRKRKLKTIIKEPLSNNIPEQVVEPNITYFFSNNANWKINLKTKSFNKNPYCSCCKPPSHLIHLPPSRMIFAFDQEEENHKCINSEKKYYLYSHAYIYAYKEAREKYGVLDKAIEDEIKRLVETGKAKVKEP